MRRLVILFLIMMGIHAANGQTLWQKTGPRLPFPVSYGSGVMEKVFIPPPADFLDSLKSAEKKSDFIVNYSLFPPKAKDAFEYAVSIWESLIESPVPIYVEARWRPKKQYELGSCGPTDLLKNFKGAPRKNIYYPIALAEKLSETEITGADIPDIVADFNENINWYFGTDGNTPGQLYDFVSVVLHEMAHGLGFFGFFLVENNLGRYGIWSLGDATSYDRLVETGTYRQLINPALYSNPSLSLKNALLSGALYADSPVAFIDGNSSRPRLFAPASWDEGSSVYHLDETTYPASNINTLMTPAFGIAQAVHDPGPLALGMLADMGWKTMRIGFDPPKDSEKPGPVHFNVSVTSDYPVDTSQLFVIFSSGLAHTDNDSIPLKESGSGIFEATWIPEPDTRQVRYYISTGDIKNRIFRNPAEAPSELYTLNFGPDTIKPVISHNPIPYLFDTGDDIHLTALAEDNIALDTVFVEYFINNGNQQSFGLAPDPAALFSGTMPLDRNLLNDGDTIHYRITAIDASMAKNTSQVPGVGYFSFRVDKMLSPVTQYSNNFNETTSDFVLFDFHVTTEAGFENGALHSPHPYPSPDQNNMEFNFTANLKYPVILTEGITMSFDEIVLVEPGDAGTIFGDFEFWDYVIAEGSSDKGKTWLPLADGYDSRANPAWEKQFNNSKEGLNSSAAGSPEGFVNRQINLLENANFSAGDTILIRFRLFSDPYAHGWGWAIDNLNIQNPVSTNQLALSPGSLQVFPNPFDGSFNISVESVNFISELQFDVYNVQGQRVQSVTHKNIAGHFSLEVAIQNGRSGMYLLVIREDGKPVATRKLIHK